MKLLFEQGLFADIPVGIENENGLQLWECSSGEADEVLKVHHYSKTVTKNRFASFRVNDGSGYIQLGYGIKPAQKHTISSLITRDNFAEFDRMWLSDKMPKFSESQVISLLLSYLKQTKPTLDFLITYADGSVGNVGVIYQATNAFYLGSVPVDFYMLPDGTRIHPVTMWHRHGTMAKDFLQSQYPGIVHVTTERQHRYLYILNKSLKKRFAKEFGEPVPYPRKDAVSPSALNGKPLEADVNIEDAESLKEMLAVKVDAS